MGRIYVTATLGYTSPGVYCRQPCGCALVIPDWLGPSCPSCLGIFASPDNTEGCEAGIEHDADEVMGYWNELTARV